MNSFSDHRTIHFSLKGYVRKVVRFRNPRRTNWEQYRNFLRQHVEDKLGTILPRSSAQLDEAVESITGLLTSAYEHSCPEIKSVRKKDGKIWSAGVEKLRLLARKAWSKAIRTLLEADWNAYRAAQKAFRNYVRSRAKEAWKRFCAEMEQIPDYARIHKILAKDSRLLPSSLLKPDGTFTSCGKETAKHFLEVHFPGSKDVKDDGAGPDPPPPSEEDWQLARRIVTMDRLKWAIGRFKPFKSAGDDGIFPALLKESGEILLEPLREVLLGSLALGHIPTKWEKVKVTFIPKPGKPSHVVAKDFRPISLTSFVLKTLERLIVLYIREEILVRFPLHANQHAYQAGKSTDSALHCLVSGVERSLEIGEIALACFMDIEGAFDNTGFEIIGQALRERGVAPVVVRWVDRMLRDRTVEANVCGLKTNLWVAKGCPQGGILSPLLWCLVVDSLLKRLNENGIFAQGYSDDLTILVRGKFESTLGDRVRMSLKIVEDWCQEKGLRVNPEKSDLVLFSRRRTGSNLVGNARLFGKDVRRSTQVKYLGVTLDSKLNWIAHGEDRAQKALTAFWICRSAFGRNWGLSSKAILWMYEAIVRPMMSHGCVVWWPRLNVGRAVEKLKEVQRLMCVCATGAMKTTATAAMEVLLDLPPVDVAIKARAFATADRLTQHGLWTPNFQTGHGKIKSLLTDPIFEMPRDKMIPKMNFTRNFEAIFPDRSEWLNGWPSTLPESKWIRFTDGSKTEGGTGAGMYNPETGTGTWISLGKLSSIFQAETFAALTGARELLPEGIRGREVLICTDSESAMKALISPVVTSKLIEECKGYLNQMGQRNRIHLVWVPGHAGVDGNEKADELAKAGSAGTETRPEPCIPIPQSLCAKAVKDWVRAEHVKRWTAYEGGVHAKHFLPAPWRKWTRELITMNRNSIRRVVGAITGHCGLNKHLTRMRILDDSECSCGQDEETGLHIICECPKFSQLRRKTLGNYVLQPSDVTQLGPIVLDRFLAGTRRFT